MYAKVFRQIFNSSLAEDFQVRHVFMDLLVLAEPDGTVDITLSAIARQTNVPLDLVTRAMAKLSEPDPQSRTMTEEGRRLVPISPDRPWGWRIVNFELYHDIRNEPERRAYLRKYMRGYRRRGRKTAKTSPDTPSETPENQTEKQTYTQTQVNTNVNTVNTRKQFTQGEGDAATLTGAELQEAAEKQKQRPMQSDLAPQIVTCIVHRFSDLKDKWRANAEDCCKWVRETQGGDFAPFIEALGGDPYGEAKWPPFGVKPWDMLALLQQVYQTNPPELPRSPDKVPVKRKNETAAEYEVRWQAWREKDRIEGEKWRRENATATTE